VTAESIQVLFTQGVEVKSLVVQTISDIQSPDVLMNLFRSHLTESVRDMMTRETGSAVITAWKRSNLKFEIQAFQIKRRGSRKTCDDPIRNLNCVSVCNQSHIVPELKDLCFYEAVIREFYIIKNGSPPKCGQTITSEY
jgi:hypothetical protein